MGEQQQKAEQKNEGAAPPAEGGGKKAAAEVVLKMDLHCEGCAKKVRRSVSHFEGVEKVKTDCGSGKLTVIGDVDPAWLRERVESKTKKKVDILSPQPKKDAGAAAAGAADKKPQDTVKKAAEDDQKKPKEAVVSTVAMKLKLHCEGCAHKIKRMILKNVDGANSVTLNLEKDVVTVTGTMAAKELSSYLQQKLNRAVEIIPPPKKDDGGGDKKENDKKEKEGGGEKKEKEKEKEKEGGGEKKEKEKEKEGGGDKKDGGGGGGKTEKKEGGGGEVKKSEDQAKVEVVNRMEFQGYNPQTLYAMPVNQYHHMYNQSYANQDYGMYHHHNNVGYAVHYSNGPPPPPPTYIDDQMFSDENPNGCSVM